MFVSSAADLRGGSGAGDKIRSNFFLLCNAQHAREFDHRGTSFSIGGAVPDRCTRRHRTCMVG